MAGGMQLFVTLNHNQNLLLFYCKNMKVEYDGVAMCKIALVTKSLKTNFSLPFPYLMKPPGETSWKLSFFFLYLY